MFSAIIRFSSLPNGPNCPFLTSKPTVPLRLLICSSYVAPLSEISVSKAAVPESVSFMPAASSRAFSTSIPRPVSLIFRREVIRFIEIFPLTLPSKALVLRFLILNILLASEIPA